MGFHTLRQFNRPVVVGTPVVYRLNSFNPGGLTFRMTPGALGTIKVQYQVTSDDAWIEGPLGEVTVATEDTIDSPIAALKFIATVADGSVSIAQA